MISLTMGSYFSWQIAAIEAMAGKFQFIEQEHLFIGILSLEKLIMLNPEKIGLKLQDIQALQIESKFIEDLLHELNIDGTKIRRQVRKKLGNDNYKHTEKMIHRSEICKSVFKRSEMLAQSSKEISCLHFFAAIMEDPSEIIRQVVKMVGSEPATLRENALVSIANWQEVGKIPVKIQNGHSEIAHTNTPYLDRYGRDLTTAARERRIGPFIGRRKEILQVIQTLARSSKNNPVLVGEAGVGKTAIVEALALRVAKRKDPQFMSGKRIVEINIGALISGTKYRGEFEERLSRIIDEARSHPEVIVFIDELHNVIGAGRAEGSLDAANLMKPALARGDLRCIGATTIREYQQYIEADPALERRFEKVIVNEPSLEESLEMLKGIRPKWEKHHGVRITDKALKAAIDLSVKFDVDHQLPDKAIDIVDKAGARIRIPSLSGWIEGDNVNLSTVTDETSGPSKVTEITIAHVLADKIGVPIEIITGHIEGMKQTRLFDLESFLKKKIVGQENAINLVCQRLLMSHIGLTTRRGPLAVFLFAGPTGVGKTELARLLAEFLFGNDSKLMRFDMSEFMEEHSIAKLIGSPPGYVGHEEEGQLTGQLRKNPYSVVLFDEVEKAHQRVFDLCLQLFDNGRLTDGKGRTADARHAIFIMTSNICIGKRKKSIGFGKKESVDSHLTAIQEIKKYFRVEFVNRINDIVVFQPLNEEHVRQILKLRLPEICNNVKAKHNITLKIEDEVEDFIVQAGYSSEYGARELHRAIERFIQVPLTNLILSGEYEKSSNWQVICGDMEISIIPFNVDKKI